VGPIELGQCGTFLLGEVEGGAHRRLSGVATKYGVPQQARGYRVRLSLEGAPPPSITIIMNVGNKWMEIHFSKIEDQNNTPEC
jgi:hypothetical protein